MKYATDAELRDLITNGLLKSQRDTGMNPKIVSEAVKEATARMDSNWMSIKLEERKRRFFGKIFELALEKLRHIKEYGGTSQRSPTMNECKSCGAALIWVKTDRGKMMPLNASPDPAGNVVIINGIARVFRPDLLFDTLEPRYMAHWAT